MLGGGVPMLWYVHAQLQSILPNSEPALLNKWVVKYDMPPLQWYYFNLCGCVFFHKWSMITMGVNPLRSCKLNNVDGELLNQGIPAQFTSILP